MSVIRSSQFKTTTIWPELVHKRLQTVTIQLKESQFSKQNHWVSLKGLLLRRVCYFDYDGRNRKIEDQLQFEVMLADAETVIDPALLSIELQHDYFIFQPRYIGESQAIFEHAFTIIVHQANQLPLDSPIPGSIVPVLAKLISGSGEGSTVMKGPVLIGGAGLKPGMLHSRVDFADTHESSIVSGALQGVISYLNPQNARLENEFEQPFSLCLKLPALTPSQQFMITGEVTDGHWWFDPATPKWQLELKLHYSWRIVEETELNCLSQNDSTPGRHPVKIPVQYQNTRLQIPKSFRIPAGNFALQEVNICKPNLNVRLTSKGILLMADFLVEIYATDDTGQECYQCHPVSDSELIAEKWAGDSLTTVISISAESEVKLMGFSLFEGDLTVETVIDCRLNRYQHHWLDLNLAVNPNGYILGMVLKEQKTFTISGFQKLQLRAGPLLVRELTVSSIKIHPHIKPGWIHMAGEFQLGVSYLDKRQCLREDTFPVFFQETFLWDNLQPAEEVDVTSRLEHDSYALNPNNPLYLNYCFWLHLTAESIEKRELPVTIIRDSLINQSKLNTVASNISKRGGIRQDLPSMAGSTQAIHLPITCGLRCSDLELEGEVPLKLGKAREIAGGRFSISHFNYRNMVEFIWVEGHLNGEIEYWDNDGYLRREQVSFSFWKCIRRTRDVDPGNNGLTPGLNRFRYSPVNVPAWRKGSVKIQCVLELNPIGEEGVPS